MRQFIGSLRPAAISSVRNHGFYVQSYLDDFEDRRIDFFVVDEYGSLISVSASRLNLYEIHGVSLVARDIH